MEKTLVTQILCLYNEEQFIRSSLESLLNQTYRNLEIIVIDDGSTDNSVAIVEEYDDDRIKLIKNKENLGLACRRNQGLDIANGGYIGFTDADDISKPERIETLVDFLDKNPNIDIVSSGCEYIDVEGNKILADTTCKGMKNQDVQVEVLFGNPILGPVALFKSKIAKEFHIRHDPKYRVSQDWNFWHQCLAVCTIELIPDRLYLYRVHDSKAREFAIKNSELQAGWRTDIIKFAWNSKGIRIDDNEAGYLYRRIYKQKNYFNMNERKLLKSILGKIDNAKTTENGEYLMRVKSKLICMDKEVWYPSKLVLSIKKRIFRRNIV